MLKGLLAYVDDINKVDQHRQTAAHIASKNVLSLIFKNYF